MKAAGIILAGGKSSRFKGNKALVEIASQRLIDRIIGVLGAVLPELILVTNSPAVYQGLGVKLTTDLIPDKGPLSGIHAGLVASSYSLNFITGCDMPFIKAELVEFLINRASPQDDVVVPVVNGYAEPLAAVYRKTCIPLIESALRKGYYKVTGFYSSVQVAYVDEAELPLSVDRNTFFNINTREDLIRVFPDEKNKEDGYPGQE